MGDEPGGPPEMGWLAGLLVLIEKRLGRPGEWAVIAILGAFALALLVGAVGFTIRTVASVWPARGAPVDVAAANSGATTIAPRATPLSSAPIILSSASELIPTPARISAPSAPITLAVRNRKLAPQAFTNKTLGDCSPIVTGSGASANPDCSKHYAGTPPATLTFTEHVVTPVGEHVRKVLEVHVATSRAIPAAAIALFFSAPITFTQDYFTAHPVKLVGASLQSLDISGPLSSAGMHYPNSLAIIVNAPAAFTASQDLVVTVESESDVHVLRVMEINMGRDP
jgi:hypothetical protein